MIKNFPDHHKFSNNEVSNIIKTAREKKLSIVCTEKDYVKIPPQFKKFINVAYLEMKIFSSKKLIELINKKINKNLTVLRQEDQQASFPRYIPQCRCGPVALPVIPTDPISSPIIKFCPSVTKISFKCAKN